MPTNPALAEITELVGSVDLGPGTSRLLTRIARLIAHGHPLGDNQVAGVIDDLGIDKAEALKRLAAYTERDDNGDIVGTAPGITLRPTTHRFTTDTAQIWAWCAGDTFILPVVLNQHARVETTPPGSTEPVRFTATPDGVFDIDPAGAVVSIPGLIPGANPADGHHLAVDLARVAAVAEIWAAFCHHSHAFSSLAEGRESFPGRDDVIFVSPSEAFEVLHGFAERLLAYA